MKKPTYSLLLTALLLLACAGCRSSDRALDRILEAGVLRVGMDASFPPFEYVDGEGNLAGFDVDLARAVADHLGVEAQFVANLPYDGLYDALTTQRVDVVISALYVDPTRMARFAYSASYFNAGHVLVTGETTTDIEAMEDLAGRTLAVTFGSEGDVAARTWNRRLADLTILPCDTPVQALDQVASGQADAALVDHVSALARTGAGTGLQVVGDPVTDEPYAIAVWGENRRLLRAINDALEHLEEDGTLEALKIRWFRPD
jgi:polar amino acid transport system substrate-binding protein